MYSVDQDAVEVDDADCINETNRLVGGRGSLRYKGHHQIFGMATSGSETGFPFVTLLDAYAVVGVLVPNIVAQFG